VRQVRLDLLGRERPVMDHLTPGWDCGPWVRARQKEYEQLAREFQSGGSRPPQPNHGGD
jgi:hypothetical protein